MEHHFGRSMEQLLAPIGENQVGESVRHNGVYFAIKEARRSDDPTLPQGVWTHELKTADWSMVEKTALDALCKKSKDLQLGVWLMESRIHRSGFAGVAPAAVLIRVLCEAYWDSMHPQMQDGDIEFRTNPINWINEKLSLQLRLAPITRAPLDGDEFCWDDWDQAQRLEQLKRQKRDLDIDSRACNSESFKQRLAASPKEFIYELCEHLEDGVRAAQELVSWLDEKCGEASPGLGEITHLMNDVLNMMGDELRRRGLRFTSAGEASGQRSEAGSAEGSGEGSADGSGGGSGGSGGDGGGRDSGGPLNSRADAFAQLREAAEFLMRDEPHSPVPYLVYTACNWGEKSAPDLYQEIFLTKGGQLNIFELMGLQMGQSDEGGK